MSPQDMHATRRMTLHARRAALLCLAAGYLVACGGSQVPLTAGTMPDEGSFTGVWFSPQYGRMDMIQNGNAVVGEYKKDERTGKIQGTVEGNLLKFTWEEQRALVANRPTTTRGRGYFHYSVGGDNQDHEIKGEWGVDDQHSGGGPWTAVKSRKLEPQLSFGTSGSDSGSSGYDSHDDYEGDADDSLDDLL